MTLLFKIFHRFVAGEENDFISDGEESGGGAGGEEAVDLTAARSHQGDEDDKDADDPLGEDEEDGGDEQDEQYEDEEGSRKQIRHRQDAENNNNFVGSGSTSAGIFPPAGTSHVTLEALQNTKVAVAQFAATALAGGADSDAALQDLAFLQSTLYNLQHQQVLQLQFISQLQQQLSITQKPPVAQPSSVEPADSKEASSSPIIHPKPLSSLTSPPSSRPPSHHLSSPAPLTPNLLQERPTSTSSASPLNLPLSSSSGTTSTTATTTSSQITLSHQMPPLCSISSSLASSIITNNDPPPLHEPNTLEMLQKRAQEVLDNASQGLLANNLADELAFRGSKGSRLSPYDSKASGGRGEPFFKHRCRFCGKVFGSDSALQIHIRSHTGERPFKCNVCGSRFTTKGNLKVHFQRHTAKFPHVKMNPNPVPEHLDKYHPPLLQQIASGQRPISPPPPPHAIHHPSCHPARREHSFLPPQPPLPLSLTSPGMILCRLPVINHRDDQDVPENLSKPVTAAPPMSPTSPAAVSNSHHSFHDNHQQQQQQKQQLEQREEIKLEQRSPGQDQYQQRLMSQEDTERITPKREPEETEEPVETEEGEDFEETTRRSLNSPSSLVNPSFQPQAYEDCSMDSKISGRLEGDGEMEMDEETEEQPENLSGKGTINRLPQQMMAYPGASPASSSASSSSLQTSFAGILFPSAPAHHQIPSHLPVVSTAAQTPTVSANEMIDPAKDPAIYSSLLPRPGSNDNSWESLIEITKTSETSKLQQLVDNIEHKLTDPNQCIVCHRVLSCKSALLMHYRTHTGERPFKCKICGRAFTTKGNLKTHMGVHRAKPPLRVLHQCPVCHKKFTNALVLQQHIRLHTGEPTDLSPEQIQAAEVNEFPGCYPQPQLSFFPQGFTPMHATGPGFTLGFPGSRQPSIEQQSHENDVDLKEESQQQRQRFMEEHSEEIEDQDDEEQDRREDDDRCEVNRDRRSAEMIEKEQEHENEETEHRDMIIPMFSTSLAALENQVKTITTTIATTTIANAARSPPSFHRYNGSEKSDSSPTSGAPLDLTPRASSTPASVASASPTPPPLPPPSQTVPSHHPSHPFSMFTGLLQAVSSAPVTSTPGTSNINSVTSMSAINPGSVPGSGPLASLTTSAVLAASSTYNPLGLAVGGPAGRLQVIRISELRFLLQPFPRPIITILSCRVSPSPKSHSSTPLSVCGDIFGLSIFHTDILFDIIPALPLSCYMTFLYFSY